MPFVDLLMAIIVIGVLAWAATRFIPMRESFKNLIWTVSIICAVLYALMAFGILSAITSVRVPQIR